jgi:pimeloyl-ACP methyl ester carboxylesterase
MGGELLMDLAFEHPELAATLTLVNSTPSGFEPQGEPPPYLFEMMGAMEQGDMERASELQLRIWVDGPQRAPDQVDAKIRQYAGEMNCIFVNNRTWVIADLQPLSPLNPPAIERLDTLKIPTLVISGALDHAENLRAAGIMAEAIPGARYVTIPENAHVPNMETPQRFNQIVLEFLQRVGALPT